MFYQDLWKQQLQKIQDSYIPSPGATSRKEMSSKATGEEIKE